MAGRGRKVEITPIEDDRVQTVHDHPDRGRMEALYDQKLHNAQLRRERSAAFWMAASIWGVSGLVIGACLGAYMTFAVYTGVTPTVRDTLVQGQAMREATETVNSRPSLVDREVNQGQ